MRRVLFISYYFPPEPGGGVQRSAKFVKYLPQFGWQPTVVTIDASLRAESDPTLLQGLDGAEIVRTRPSALPAGLMRRRLVRGALDRVLVPDSQITWKPEARRAIRRLAERERFDAIYTTCKPFSVAGLGREMQRELGVPWVLDFRDLWSGNPRFEAEMLTPMHRRAHEKAEREALAACDYFLATSPSSLQQIVDKAPRLRNRSDWIPNGFDPDDFASARPERTPDGPMRVVYTGACYPPYSPEASFGMLRDWSARSGRPFELHYAGLHEEAFAQAAVRSGIGDTLRRHGHLDHAGSIALMRGADLLLMFLPDVAEARGWIPGKLYEYLAAGAPIFCVAGPGDATAIVIESRAGVVIGPTAQAEGVAALDALWRRRAEPQPPRAADVIARFNRRAHAARLAEILDSLANPTMETSC